MFPFPPMLVKSNIPFSNKNDLTFSIKNINQCRFDMLNQIHSLGILCLKGVILGGGSLQTLVNRDINVNDYDIFFQDFRVVPAVENILEKAGYKKIFQCKQHTLTTYYRKGLPKIQLIKMREYYDGFDLIHQFDITACMWAYDGATVYTTKQAIHDTKKRVVKFNKIEYPLATLNRISKYKYVKKFSITLETYEEFFKKSNINISDINKRFYID